MGQCCSQEPKPFIVAQDVEVEPHSSDKTASSTNQIKETPPLIQTRSVSKKHMYATKFEEEEEEMNHTARDGTNTPQRNERFSPAGRASRRLSMSPKKLEITHLPPPEVANSVLEGPKLENLTALHVIEKLGVFRYEIDNDDDVLPTGPYQFVGTLEVYQGQWVNGMRNGKGEQAWLDGSAYQGYWKDNLRHGKGRFVDEEGNVLEGIWKEDRLYGQGKGLYADGTFYAGTWNDGEKHGLGYEIAKDKTRYEGDYHFGVKQGRGTQTMADGGKYMGEFQNDMANGSGVMEWEDGRRYVGTFKNSKMHGKGEFSWPDGRKYVGEYSEDMKNGVGEFMWADRRKYKGGFRDNKMHGKGVMISAGGQAKHGVWESGIQLN